MEKKKEKLIERIKEQELSDYQIQLITDALNRCPVCGGLAGIDHLYYCLQ